MSIICNLNNLPQDITNSVVTIGNFDGVHRAH
ncbi:MAG: riboflavin biosynthesis protein RibF, partial [Deltaproteobacteria bacterium]|nr:riboflavin biosynthesis protein RibF [Deltaproteobacteria bacterium]